MSKKIFILSIIGFVFLGSGIALFFHFAINIEERYPELVIFLDVELEQSQLSSTPIELLQGEVITITILSPTNEMFFSLTGPNNLTIEETVFFESLSHHLVAKTNGTYTINVGNMDTHTADVMGLLTEQPVSDEDFILSITVTYASASLLIVIGMGIVFVSIIILVLKKIRSNNNFKINSK